MQQWEWTKANEKELVKFVNRDARYLLEHLGGSRFDLSRYPSRKELVEAIYNALVAINIAYGKEIPSEEDTQIIRTPHQILAHHREGTCLDLALLFCGVCLGCELLPLIVITERHAFAAVSLNYSRDQWNDYASERSLFNTTELFAREKDLSKFLPGEDNLSKLKKLIDKEAYIAIECTGFAHGNGTTLSFDNALIAGRKQLENPDPSFKFAIDIAVAHRGWGITPLAIDVGTDNRDKLADILGCIGCIESLTIKDLDMDSRDKLEDILGHIGSGVHTPADLERLRQIIAATGTRSIAINSNAKGANNSIAGNDNNNQVDILFQGNGFKAGDHRYDDGAKLLRSILESISPSKANIDLHQSSRTLLNRQLQLTTNPLTRGQDIRYEVEDVYVPLGLLERKKQPIQMKDITPEQGSDLGRERGIGQFINATNRETQVEITKEFKHDEFLNEVFLQGRSPKSQGKRIAIIGEPGAGKTTLLQQIARWIESTFPSAIVIWVSLANLQQDEKLEKYLETQWLTSLLRQAGGADVSTDMKEIFSTHVQKGQVWLLLDGLDEMQGKNTLSKIQRQIQDDGWLQQMRIVMTCRLNLWDENWNELETFDTYRTLNFDYPQQVEMFIEKWFAPREVGSSEKGKKLCKALKEPGNERIRDLMKNPLRLSLMCFSWFVRGGELPKTQAELYQRFVERIYDWKHKKFPTTTAQKQQLNQQLAKLSREAIDDGDKQGKGRFRLREDFVKQHLDIPIHQGGETFFDLALRLGWLNRVGLDADDPEREIYAFFHATFQEYFAALGIDDDRFFLTPVMEDPLDMPKNPLDPPSYRVFERQWRQVFLLWLGRKDLDNSRKEKLIETLMNFQDRCGEIYTDRAFLLAAVGIAEFKDCKQADAIVNKLVRWKFPSPDRSPSREELKYSGRTAARGEWATNTFICTDSQRVIESILRVLKTTQDDYTRRSVAEILGKIGTGNETAIQTQVQVLKNTQDRSTRRSAIEILGKIATGNEIAIQALVGVLKTTQDESTRWSVAGILGNIGTGNETAIQALVGVLKITQDDYTRWSVAEILGKIDPGNETAIQALVGVLKTTQDDYIHQRVAEILGRIGTGKETAIQALVGVLKTTHNKSTRWSWRGRKISVGEISLEETFGKIRTGRVAEILGKIDPGKETAIQALVGVLKTTQDESTRWSVAEILGKIDLGNETAIQALVGVLKTTQNESTRWSVAEILGEIGTGKETVIQALVELLKTTQNESTRWSVTKSLGKIGIGNETAIQALFGVLKTTQNESTRWSVAEILGEIGTGNQTAIQVLVRSLHCNLEHKEAHILMMKCAELLSYKDFYQAFHNK